MDSKKESKKNDRRNDVSKKEKPNAVDEAGKESFPASDPPSRTPITGINK